jgi:TonB family protein
MVPGSVCLEPVVISLIRSKACAVLSIAVSGLLSCSSVSAQSSEAMQARPSASCDRPAWTAEALQARDFGTLKLRLLIDKDGAVKDVKVLASTQSVSLDSAGIAAASKCRYVPLTADGKAQDAWMLFSFAWPHAELPQEEPAPTPGANTDTAKDCKKPEYPKSSLRNEEKGTVKLSFEIDVDGKVLQGKIVRSSGFKALDDAALVGIGKCPFKPATENGAPVRSWVMVQYVWALE